MASASLGHGGVGSSRTVSGFNESSSAAVDRLGRGMLEMRIRDKVERDDDKVSVSTFSRDIFYDEGICVLWVGQIILLLSHLMLVSVLCMPNTVQSCLCVTNRVYKYN